MELGRARDRTRHSDHMRALSLNIFSQCRRLLVHTNNVKSLTGFGTAAQADVFLKNKSVSDLRSFLFSVGILFLGVLGEEQSALQDVHAALHLGPDEGESGGCGILWERHWRSGFGPLPKLLPFRGPKLVVGGGNG